MTDLNCSSGDTFHGLTNQENQWELVEATDSPRRQDVHHGTDVNDGEETDGDDTFSAFSEADVSMEEPTMRTVVDALADSPVARTQSLDLVTCIDGMFRILDLVSEQGSGGLVDKIVIAQVELSRFLNELYPGAYTSLTKVDYNALDSVPVRPIGVYGSKSEIVRFLRALNAIDAETEKLLLASQDESPDVSQPILRPGLYVLPITQPGTSERWIYVIFWPEETTWDDAAISTVKRNRVTFIRYLTQITNQLIVLISNDHCQNLVWSDSMEDDCTEMDIDESDRVFDFEVSKTNEQEESVAVVPGFKFKHRIIQDPEPPVDGAIDTDQLQTRIIRGETNQAIMTAKYVPVEHDIRTFDETLNGLRLKRMLRGGDGEILHFSEHLNNKSLAALMNLLKEIHPSPVQVWERRTKDFIRQLEEENGIARREFEKRRSDSPRLLLVLESMIADNILMVFPTLNRHILKSVEEDAISEDIESENQIYISNFFALHPDIPDDAQYRKEMDPARFSAIRSRMFQSQKAIVLMCRQFFTHLDLPDRDRQEFLDLIQMDDANTARAYVSAELNAKAGKKTTSTGLPTKAFEWLARRGMSLETINATREAVQKIDDPVYVADLDEIVNQEPVLAEHVEKSRQYLYTFLARQVKTIANKVRARVEHMEKNTWEWNLFRESKSRKKDAQTRFRIQLLEELNAIHANENARLTTVLGDVEAQHKYRYGYGDISYRVSGKQVTRKDPAICYSVYPLHLTEHDKHEMQMDPEFIPTPLISERFSAYINIPIGHAMEFIQIIDGDMCLLILDNRRGKLYVFLEDITTLNMAIERGKYKKLLHRDKLGQTCVIAYDQSKRMLAVCGTNARELTVHLHIFAFDERFASLQGQGNATNLLAWYDKLPAIEHLCFISGTEELALIEACGRARTFSLITQQFRPAALQLPGCPSVAYSSPDGACLITLFNHDDGIHLTVYHWTSFGSNDGFDFKLPDDIITMPAASSLEHRGNVHLLACDPRDNTCLSIKLDITCTVTEFMFRKKGACARGDGSNRSTKNNSLIDCHADVWTRFPVIPAIPRQTIVSAQGQNRPFVMFVATCYHDAFGPYFDNMIQSFQQSTRKPTDSALSSIHVEAKAFPDLLDELDSRAHWSRVSCLRAGEWMVNLLCLIPIHIAIARDNRFIPLKDGVWTPDLERSLLGVEVGRIVDFISFGWYESIFQSYMSTKPVRVVSSMGEQSVGKSFALNHLVDTSFAGSAMRTTEGIWMSVTPTHESLIVALDFEGVHSIERSAQEDMLLVLFNTAISNLVLFRNNFAISRDITTLFHSFQSSSSVLDPAVNPSLFQSTLVIIIKDVIASDKKEVTQEFSLRLQKIVREEQNCNFLTRLHRGQLSIIPWPVIESPQFYSLFTVLKRQLENKPPTYKEAGTFLHMLKVLMAKLKANDWGSLSQNIASHRAQRLLRLLPLALTFAATEIEPEFEPLRNFDTNAVINVSDSPARLWLNDIYGQAGKGGLERTLRELCEGWFGFNTRTSEEDSIWVNDLSNYLDDLVAQRLDHVQEWIRSNTSRFTGNHAGAENLRRAFEVESVELMRNVQLCKTTCNDCHLHCIRAKLHEGLHHCATDHKCSQSCQFAEEHSWTSEPCCLPAGHSGEHICNSMPHLCGEECNLIDKIGCQGACTKVAGHDDMEHICSTRMHACGKGCDLGQEEREKTSMCEGTCVIPWDEDHDQHICEKQTTCPYTCQLCKRFCATPDHLHGLDPSEKHLCGKEHRCQAVCAATGICEIATQPQSIEATFTGRHETFQYTKYTQVATRLPCVIPIAPNDLTHSGAHSHAMDPNPFHYCESRCDNCGYFCTLTQGHPQQEHETSHGSMSKTQWAIAGPDGTVLQLDGHKFGSNDEGAPMLCSQICRNMDRHLHIDYCRATSDKTCNHAGMQHIMEPMNPNPERPKDWVTHSLSWSRLGFRDPYSKDEQANFAKCDAMCSGLEHQATASRPSQPSYCTLPMFHPPQKPGTPGRVDTIGHVSNDGHAFLCQNPSLTQQTYHVIFLIDKSASMRNTDRRPLPDTPSYDRIVQSANNRLGAVYSSLHAFWMARSRVVATGNAKRDAYSVIFHDQIMTTCFENNLESTPDQLLERLLPTSPSRGNSFDGALKAAKAMMERHWSSERAPVVIFLSDGACSVGEKNMNELCRSAKSFGKALSFHGVSFGPVAKPESLRRMAEIARKVQATDPADPSSPVVESSSAEALETVRLAETFLNLAESLKKPRASLLRN